ncbi:Microfibril-associated glycoprotein 4 [Anabarilius grahami]|uniref:Microfibril-associated glycoprotein 4 n=1 Tax=Anabarilius grahami TaxID=495550 RepID=A0A3N0Z8Q6_ANAGA|nr:Microfibril-associated glycoprotein 4 [Anabarilius grahami]
MGKCGSSHSHQHIHASITSEHFRIPHHRFFFICVSPWPDRRPSLARQRIATDSSCNVRWFWRCNHTCTLTIKRKLLYDKSDLTMMVFLVALLPVVLGIHCKLMPFDCSDIYNSGQTVSGFYTIYPAADVPVWVYCHMISDGKDEDKGGWTVRM